MFHHFVEFMNVIVIYSWLIKSHGRRLTIDSSTIQFKRYTLNQILKLTFKQKKKTNENRL